MKKVKLAQIAGFCMGVREAMDLALEVCDGFDGPLYTYGPLIHNPPALQLLEEKGIRILKDIPQKGEGTVIIRAHGISPDERERLEKANFTVIDGTCPRVIKVQSLAAHYSQKGFYVIVIGDKGHPEVKGILGHAQDKGILISNEEDLERLSIRGEYIIVAQTTQDRERFNNWVARIRGRFPDGKVFDTICDSTKRRQEEVRRLSKEADAVVVVGGQKSANSKRLAEIAQEEGKTVFFVETEEDIDENALREFSCIGVTAGASTPNWVINGVLKRIEAIPSKNEFILKRIAWNIMRFLHESNLLTGMAGASLSIGSSVIFNIESLKTISISALIAFIFVFSMHTLNRLIDHKTLKFNDPIRSAFLNRYKAYFYLASITGLFISLALSLTISLIKFFLLMSLILLGLMYSSTMLKNLPGSKTIFIAGAWATVATLISCPAPFQDATCWITLLFAFSLICIRDVLMELIDVQGDRLVGKETLTILIGEEKILMASSYLSILMAVISSAIPLLFKPMPMAFNGFSIAFIYSFLIIYRFKRERLSKSLRLEMLVEGMAIIFMITTVFSARLSS